MLVDRGPETAVLQGLLDGIKDGTSGVLVLCGDAGIGKTSLLDWAVAQAAGMQVARAAGVESEMNLSLAALHQLLSTFLSGLEHLPTPQRGALETAFGLAPGPTPDRFLVGLAALTLLADAAAVRPVLCVVDDTQWVDRASTELLSFVARRLEADRVGMLFAVRETDQPNALLAGLPQLVVGGLPDEAARDLLARSAAQPIGEHVSRQLVADAAGNPLALIEFATQLGRDDLAARPPLGRPSPIARRLEQAYEARLRALPDDARALLLIVAASQLDDPERIMLAAEQLGIGPDAAERLSSDGLVTFEPRVRIRHPLVRSAAYYSAPVSARRRAHEALAAATDPVQEPDRWAWNLAQAAPGPDEHLALELERSAERARRRGGLAAGADFIERAAELTPECGRAAERMLRAADARLHAGELAACRSLLARALPHLEDPFARARAKRLEGLVLQILGDVPGAVATLAQAASMIEPFDARLARDTRLDALTTTWLGDPHVPVAEVLRAVRSDAAAEKPGAQLPDLLLQGFAAALARRYEEAVRLFRRATAPLARHDAALSEETLRYLLPLSLAARFMHSFPVLDRVECVFVEELRRRGALGKLLGALLVVAFGQLRQGRLAAAGATIAEGQSLSEATGSRARLFDCAELLLLSWRGREAEVHAVAAGLLRDFGAQGESLKPVYVHEALAQLELGLGNYPAALHWSLEGISNRLESAPPANLVEAAMRSGEAEAARSALEPFSAPARASGTDFDLGLLARCQALLAVDDTEAQYRRSIDLLQHGHLCLEEARSQLLYGEWLRREGRRREARDQLRSAVETFDELDMEVFGERARAELRATGEHARKRTADQSEALTPQESQIALLASQGATNREIAAKLFISAATVDSHLRKVYRKLGVASRIRLSQVLTDPDLPRHRGAG
jgi:DNA-binding CsgD family transcriptional regulator